MTNLPDQLAAMREKFTADFGDGLMGRHHNSFQHRARVLRQATAAHRLRSADPDPK